MRKVQTRGRGQSSAAKAAAPSLVAGLPQGGSATTPAPRAGGSCPAAGVNDKRDMENTLADAIGVEAALTKSAVSRVWQATGAQRRDQIAMLQKRPG